jgi:hypothetical protein
MAKKGRMPTDVNQRAKAIVDFATGTAGKGKVTPAMAAGIETHPWSITQLCELLEG